jgi:hypothetical protein
MYPLYPRTPLLQQWELSGKYNIPIIRMKTTGSGEEEKLRLKLGEILFMDMN